MLKVTHLGLNSCDLSKPTPAMKGKAPDGSSRVFTNRVCLEAHTVEPGCPASACRLGCQRTWGSRSFPGPFPHLRKGNSSSGGSCQVVPLAKWRWQEGMSRREGLSEGHLVSVLFLSVAVKSPRAGVRKLRLRSSLSVEVGTEIHALFWALVPSWVAVPGGGTVPACRAAPCVPPGRLCQPLSSIGALGQNTGRGEGLSVCARVNVSMYV